LKITLILGGARSGKSRLAQEMASKAGGGVLFVATAEPGDEEMKRRIEMHRQNRPPGWRTLEATTGLGEKITPQLGAAKTVIIDCITLLVSNILGQHPGADEAALHKAVSAEIDGLLDVIKQADARFIIVSNEVGLGLVPPDPASRHYRDLLGQANQRLAARADAVYLLIAGIPVAIKKP
jgi:adenosylcobinamide kinase/adenosylcobinamide-phosphate guanylyltransferase